MVVSPICSGPWTGAGGRLCPVVTALPAPLGGWALSFPRGPGDCTEQPEGSTKVCCCQQVLPVWEESKPGGPHTPGSLSL